MYFSCLTRVVQVRLRTSASFVQVRLRTSASFVLNSTMVTAPVIASTTGQTFELRIVKQSLLPTVIPTVFPVSYSGHLLLLRAEQSFTSHSPCLSPLDDRNNGYEKTQLLCNTVAMGHDKLSKYSRKHYRTNIGRSPDTIPSMGIGTVFLLLYL